jgi:outer membrane protein OmpA-like peptidoglycan-associated protein
MEAHMKFSPGFPVCIASLASVLAIAGASAADFTTPVPGPYISLGAGITVPEPDHGDILGPVPGPGLARPRIPTKFSWDTGYNVIGAFGWKTRIGLRPEIELGWRSAAIDRVNGVPWSGNQNVAGVMANVLYDFDSGGRLTPYAGGGVGVARQRFDNIRPPSTPSAPVPPVYTGHDTNFQWQLIAGVSGRITDRLSAFIDYRYIRLDGSSIHSRAVSCGCAHIVRYDNASHNVIVGLRYALYRPAPKPVAPVAAAAPTAAPIPPPPVAAPPTPQKILLFFDFDKANLRDDALKIVHEAVAYAKNNDKTVIWVTGHTDTSGPDAYNLALSKRRALAVKDEMVREGIPEKDIHVAWKGESEPLVNTGDGVKEARNRRVEILYD